MLRSARLFAHALSHRISAARQFGIKRGKRGNLCYGCCTTHLFVGSSLQFMDAARNGIMLLEAIECSFSYNIALYVFLSFSFYLYLYVLHSWLSGSWVATLFSSSCVLFWIVRMLPLKCTTFGWELRSYPVEPECTDEPPFLAFRPAPWDRISTHCWVNL